MKPDRIALMPSALLTHDEAAARLHVCAKTLRSLRQRGLIRYVAITPRKILYRIEDCEAYLASCVRVDEAREPTRRKSTRRGRADSNVVSFSARRRERLEARRL